ncbi:tetratricopeptide repeat protein [Leptothermofonsia sp. ETS-13]|uniref:tetratricopeptide repeat protein n=1 Tax=Leptothermofonsia sp. ETS-13 TaxID=3035696 RepID=UPI003B9F638B
MNSYRVFPKLLLTLLTTSVLIVAPVLGVVVTPAQTVLAQLSPASSTKADQLLKEGQTLLTSAATRRALMQFQQALQLYRQDGNRLGEANALNGVGDAHYSLGQYQLALKVYSQAWEIYQELGDRKGGATVLNNIGAIYDDQRQYSEALKFYEQALKLRREAGDLAGEGTTLNNLAGVYLNQGDYDKALKEYNAALKVRWLMGDRRGEATTLNNIGFVCRRTAQHHQSQGNLEKSREWYQSAIEHYQSALAIRRMLGDRPGEATTLNNLGFVYRSLAQYPQANEPEAQKASLQEAQQTYLKAAEIYRQLGDRKGEATVLNNLGGVYFSQGQYVDALKAYERALTAVKITGDAPEQATTLSNIAFVYRTQADALKTKDSGQEIGRNPILIEAQRQYLKALDFYQQALAIIQQVGDLKSEGTTLNNIGGINISLGRYADALNAYQKALAVYEKLGDLPGQGTTRYNIGVTYARQEKYREALSAYKRAQLIYEQLRDIARRDEIRSVIQAIENQQKAI